MNKQRAERIKVNGVRLFRRPADPDCQSDELKPVRMSRDVRDSYANVDERSLQTWPHFLRRTRADLNRWKCNVLVYHVASETECRF
jgi:hypothetical protein